MRERKSRRADREKKGISTQGLQTGGVVAALVAAVAIFVGMVQLEKRVLTQYEKGTIYIALCQIPRGVEITGQNYGQYFQARELDRSCIPATALGMPEQVEGLVPVWDIEPGVLLTQGMFQTQEDILRDLKEPVVAGFKAEDLYQVAGGVLRAGDRVHIYAVQEQKTVLVWPDVYVQQVFDASGKAIANEDGNTAAQRVNIYLDREDVESFYAQLANGSLRVGKCVKSIENLRSWQEE